MIRVTWLRDAWTCTRSPAHGLRCARRAWTHGHVTRGALLDARLRSRQRVTERALRVKNKNARYFDVSCRFCAAFGEPRRALRSALRESAAICRTCTAKRVARACGRASLRRVSRNARFRFDEICARPGRSGAGSQPCRTRKTRGRQDRSIVHGHAHPTNDALSRDRGEARVCALTAINGDAPRPAALRLSVRTTARDG